MSQEESTKPINTSKGEESNLRVLPLKRSAKKAVLHAREKEEDEVNFSELAARLENRIGKIEDNLRESIQLLEKDIQEAIKKSHLSKSEKDVRHEMGDLAKQLESRMQKTIKLLAPKKESGGADADRLEAVKKISSQLVKILSFDFYKNVLDRLGNTEHEEEIDPFGMNPRVLEQIKPVFDFLYYDYWRVTTTGIENIPDEGRALVVGNHSGTLPYDGAMIKSAILNEHPKRKDARFLVEDFVYHMPILGTFMYQIGGVRACQENAELLLKSEHLVVVFPEGVKGIGKYFRQRYKLQRFGRGGFIKLCMKTHSPLVPVGVVGAEEIHPIILKSNILAKVIGIPYIPITPTFPLLGLLGCLPLPSKWSIHFGKPLRFENYNAEAIEDELLVHKLSEKVRNEIQEIIIDLLKKRRSVWVG